MKNDVVHNDVCPYCGNEDIMLLDTDRSTYDYREEFYCPDKSCGCNFTIVYKLDKVIIK